jgi:hypothetical protein
VVRCGLLYRRGQGAVDRLCIPAGGGLRAQVFGECHDGPLRAYANGRKDDWDRQLPLAVFAINNAASTLGDGLTPFFIDRGAHPRR